MYIVNATISISDAYNPFNRQRGIINKTQTRNSVNGNAQAMIGATGCKMGESAICSLKTPYSSSLLTPVYKNSMRNKMEIISTIVVLDNQENDSILASIFRYCIAGPSMVIWLIMFNGFIISVPSNKASDRRSFDFPPSARHALGIILSITGTIL